MDAEILVVAGEASGDQHAAELVRALKARRPGLRFFGMGGDKLGEQGVERLFHAKEISVMGIVEVLPKLARILSILGALTREALRRRPALAILVDVPDFNLRLAKRLKRAGIPVVYYVSPMVWAWRKGRVKQIARDVDRMLCILPFEEPFYAKEGVSARYVGSPVLEQMPAPAPASLFRSALGLPADKPTLALLPGSRHSEIQRILPTLVATARLMAARVKELEVVVPLAPGVAKEEIHRAFHGSGLSPRLVEGHAPEVVGASDGAIVASGTAALEAGLMERPMVVVYRVSRISYWVGRLFLKVAHVALVNLLAGRRLVPELLQDEMTPENVARALEAQWAPEKQAEVVAGLREVRAGLGPPGAAARAAEAVLELLPKTEVASSGGVGGMSAP
jgi:lipid-A-disaccharide synthase